MWQKDVGIDVDTFLEYFNNGKAETAFHKDLNLAQSLGIHTLPSYLIETKVSSVLVCSMPSYNEFLDLIKRAYAFPKHCGAEMYERK